MCSIWGSGNRMSLSEKSSKWEKKASTGFVLWGSTVTSARIISGYRLNWKPAYSELRNRYMKCRNSCAIVGICPRLEFVEYEKEDWVPQTCSLGPCSQPFLDQLTSYVSDHLTSQPALVQLSEAQMVVTIVQILLLPHCGGFCNIPMVCFMVALEGSNLASLHQGDRISCRWSQSLISLYSATSFWSATPPHNSLASPTQWGERALTGFCLRWGR